MMQLFETILYQPIFNLFVGIYNIIPDVGVAILCITLLIKLVLYPLTAKSIKAQRELQEIQPKLLELKKKYKTDQQKLAQETMKLYSEHKVNPFGSCLPILVQIPIFLALFWVLQDGLSNTNFDLLYSFVTTPESLNAVSLGIIDLSKPNIIMALLAGGAQYLQARTLTRKRVTQPVPDAGKDEDLMAMMNKQMLYVLPVLTAIISMGLPSGVALYWFLSTAFTAVQQHFFGLTAVVPPTTTSDVIEGTVIESEPKNKK